MFQVSPFFLFFSLSQTFLDKPILCICRHSPPKSKKAGDPANFPSLANFFNFWPLSPLGNLFGGQLKTRFPRSNFTNCQQKVIRRATLFIVALAKSCKHLLASSVKHALRKKQRFRDQLKKLPTENHSSRHAAHRSARLNSRCSNWTWQAKRCERPQVATREVAAAIGLGNGGENRLQAQADPITSNNQSCRQ